MTPSRQSRNRLVTSLVALWAVIGLQMMALPPEVFAFGGGVCVMECDARGEICCCAGMAIPEHGHHGEGPAWSRLGIESSGRQCPALGTATDDSRAHGKWLWLRQRVDPAAPDEAPAVAARDWVRFGPAGVDLAALPRPPPA